MTDMEMDPVPLIEIDTHSNISDLSDQIELEDLAEDIEIKEVLCIEDSNV